VLLIDTDLTLNDLERRNSPYFAFFSSSSIALLTNYVTVVEDSHIMSVKYCLPLPSLPLLAITNPPCSAVSAIAELFVILKYSCLRCSAVEVK